MAVKRIRKQVYIPSIEALPGALYGVGMESACNAFYEILQKARSITEAKQLFEKFSDRFYDEGGFDPVLLEDRDKIREILEDAK